MDQTRSRSSACSTPGSSLAVALVGAGVFWLGLWLFDITEGRPPADWFLLGFVVIAVLQGVARMVQSDDTRQDNAPPAAATETPPPLSAPPRGTSSLPSPTDGGEGPTRDPQHDRLRGIFDRSNDAIFVIDPVTGRIIDCNPSAATLLAQDRPTLLERSLGDFQSDDGAAFRQFAARVLAEGSAFSPESICVAADGREVPTEISASVLDLEEGQVLLFMVRDISERKLAESRIQHLAYHDTLTDLPNRSLFKDRTRIALARARRSGDLGALLFLDLDNFKRINDTLGHSVGDRLLQILARRLTGALRAEDTVARLGGDEFVILVEQLGRDRDEAHRRIDEIAAKVRDAMARPYRLEGRELYVTGSIGIVTFPDNGVDVDELLRHADVAMYQAKGSGRDAARVFSEEMHRGALERLELEEALRDALRNGALELYYQPVMTLREGRMVGAEALLRWRRDDGEVLTPTEFLHQIEDTALIVSVADWVLGEAFRLAAALQEQGTLQPPCYLSVNISHLQFRQADFVDRIERLIEQTGVSPHLLQFEITEKALDFDPHLAGERLRALQAMGIRFAVDDFGTGYSSLANLKGLPIDALKIDRSFVHKVNLDASDAAIVDAVLSLSSHFGLQAIAEGVETREQALFLRSRGCELYQGNLARPPLVEQAFVEEVVQRAALATRE